MDVKTELEADFALTSKTWRTGSCKLCIANWSAAPSHAPSPQWTTTFVGIFCEEASQQQPRQETCPFWVKFSLCLLGWLDSLTLGFSDPELVPAGWRGDIQPRCSQNTFATLHSRICSERLHKKWILKWIAHPKLSQVSARWIRKQSWMGKFWLRVRSSCLSIAEGTRSTSNLDSAFQRRTSAVSSKEPASLQFSLPLTQNCLVANTKCVKPYPLC